MPTKKRIVVCCDGTWNRADELDNGVSAPTNVFKLAGAIEREGKDGAPQIVLYHSGVGAEGNFLEHIAGGAFGAGIDHIIEACYRFIAHNYAEGDEVWLFGFSRGAYTARSLAGLIRNVGLLRPDELPLLGKALDLYRSGDPETAPDSPVAIAFRNAHSRSIPIHCLGVWDTVGALGIPKHVLPLFEHEVDAINGRVSRYQFHDNVLSRSVLHAFQALAIDEHREPFAPSVWEGQDDAKNQQLEQAWFPGVHRNIGGGYEDHGLSDLTLQWMIEKANSCGLAVKTPKDCAPSVLGEIRDSMTPFYKLFGKFERVITPGVGGQLIHPSKAQRIANGINP